MVDLMTDYFIVGQRSWSGQAYDSSRYVVFNISQACFCHDDDPGQCFFIISTFPAIEARDLIEPKGGKLLHIYCGNNLDSIMKIVVISIAPYVRRNMRILVYVQRDRKVFFGQLFSSVCHFNELNSKTFPLLQLIPMKIFP